MCLIGTQSCSREGSRVVYWNRTPHENLKPTFCTCAQRYHLGTRTKFQLEILTINVISGIAYFRDMIFERSRNVSETTSRTSEVSRNGIKKVYHNKTIQGANHTHALGYTAWIQRWMSVQRATIIGSTSTKHRSDTFGWDRYLIDVEPIVIAVWVVYGVNRVV